MYGDLIMPAGFFCAGISSGIKADGSKDMAIILSESNASVAGVFTQNQVCAAPVKVCRSHLSSDKKARAIVMNSGIANACTGAAGLVAAKSMVEDVSREIGCDPQEVYICSTGRIGPQLPLDKIRDGIELLVEKASCEMVQDAAEAMMTTDTRPKVSTRQIVVDGKKVEFVGFAKGAGMIEPNMATMLSFITTNAVVEGQAFQEALSKSVDKSFNRITVDGDQSTNDTVLALANGYAMNDELAPDHPDWALFLEALHAVCFELAMMIVRDGEGADRFVTVKVVGARSDKEADLAARAVANSLLNKTAWAGTYPNWGRVMDSIGYSRALVDEGKVDVFYDELAVVREGMRSDVAQEELVSVVSQSEFMIKIDLNIGEGEAVVYTCNCTEEYVRINVT